MNKEVEEAKEYLEKYIKWETYGERNLEKDIKTILNYIQELEKENDTNYIHKKKIEEKIKELEKEIEIENNERVIIWKHKQIRILQQLIKENTEEE